MIVQSDVEAQRHIRDINITRITIIVAVRDAECEFAASQRRTIINSEEPSRTTHRTTRANSRRLIAGSFGDLKVCADTAAHSTNETSAAISALFASLIAFLLRNE